MDNIDWNDLRYLLAVARAGSAAGAARALGVSHATVLRRIQLLEKGVGAPLFDRLQTGYVPTEPGRRFVEVGEAFERALTGTHREVEGQGTDLAGHVSFTTTDSLAYIFMPDILGSFRARYPNITVDMRVSNGELDLVKREADVALRPTSAPPAGCVGRCLRPGAWGLYASAAYLAERPDHAGALHAWLIPELPLVQGPIRQWLEVRMGGGAVAASADSFLMLRQLADRGMGVALLPKIVTQRSALVLIEEPPVLVNGGLWLLTHPHLRQLGRIRAFMEHVTDAIRELAD